MGYFDLTYSAICTKWLKVGISGMQKWTEEVLELKMETVGVNQTNQVAKKNSSFAIKEHQVQLLKLSEIEKNLMERKWKKKS